MVRPLELWKTYDRGEVHDIFDPDSTFTPQTGTWGLQGIVRVPDSHGDFVFFVTFGSRGGTHDFEEEITEDGVLTWQSQPKMKLVTPTIQQFIAHNDLTNSIHLFLRSRGGLPYTYFGELGYLDHDPGREEPVYFTWQLMDWAPADSVLMTLGIVPTSPVGTISPASSAKDQLTQTPPPSVAAHPGIGGGGGRKQAVLPGQDARNRKLGLAGEQLVLKAEAERLRAAGRPDLANKIVHVSVVEGDSAGYDIKSYNLDDSVRHIEVKTTRGPASNAFYISPNEITFSKTHPDTYVLLRVYAYESATNSANYYEVSGNIETSFGLTATEYRAKLLPAAAP
jgi:hypothetical protein